MCMSCVCHMGNRRLLFLLGALAVNFFLFQSILVPYGNEKAPWSSSAPEKYESLPDEVSFPSLHSTPKYFTIPNRNPITRNASESSDSSAFTAMVEKVHIPIIEDEAGHSKWIKGMHNEAKSDLVSERNSNGGFSEIRADRNDIPSLPEKKGVGKNNILELENIGSKKSLVAILVKDSKVDFPGKPLLEMKRGISTTSQLVKNQNLGSREHDRVGAGTLQSTTSLTNLTHLENSPQKNKFFASNNSTAAVTTRRKMRCEMPPKSRMLIQEMNRILVRRRASSRAMRPRWSSKLDLEILATRSEIEHAPIVTHDKELYAPIFRNLSMFRRSYELMERTLKVYIYQDGNKPIFHQPILKGLYASEGWFMKLMEENKHFVVKDPAKAHLFYMPFSSRMLEFSLYVHNSHNRTNLRQYLKEYTDKISAKYRYFNRTGGADHFLVACHDWAAYETRHHMEYCIKALCNADVTQGFKIGRDVSLPETYIRSARNPQRDLGGKPPHQRPILAFYAGSMHGYLRPILLKHWKDRVPDMKIFGPMPPGVASKMNYIQHMKNSKYCICPKGYEVNSPRVVEAIFYECVPVIISDNFVPSFFEVLNWDAFSLILAEKDIPNLKQILLSVPKEKYLQLQLGVRRVQKHFLWHAKPLKYDLFHMTLHSIWYNRVFQIKHAPGLPLVQDGTSRFLELLSDMRNGKHSLPSSFVYLLIPGLFSNHGPLYFVATKRFFSKMGLACHIAKVHSEASVEHNAMELKLYIEEIYWGSGKPVMLLGHSKGGIDAAAALSMYWSDLKDKVAGLALVQSPYGGTPIASDILREGQIGDKKTRRILELIICKIIKGDIWALEDLTYEKRKEFIMKHKLPLDIPVISFHSEASIAPSVLATTTQIAHAELPWLVLPKFGVKESDPLIESRRQVPVMIPVSAAMAVCALHLQLRYGEKSDGLVTCRDAEVPGSVVVRPNMKLDHAWMVYSSKKKNPTEPDAREMCEALLTLLVELGKTKREVEQVL